MIDPYDVLHTTGMQRIELAASIQRTIHHLCMKKWTPQQKPFVETLINILRTERNTFLQLGLKEVYLDPITKEFNFTTKPEPISTATDEEKR